MTESDWLQLLEETYHTGWTHGVYYDKYERIQESVLLYDRIKSKGGTLPVEIVEDPSEYLPTNSTQTLNHGL